MIHVRQWFVTLLNIGSFIQTFIIFLVREDLSCNNTAVWLSVKDWRFTFHVVQYIGVQSVSLSILAEQRPIKNDVLLGSYHSLCGGRSSSCPRLSNFFLSPPHPTPQNSYSMSYLTQTDGDRSVILIFLWFCHFSCTWNTR